MTDFAEGPSAAASRPMEAGAASQHRNQAFANRVTDGLTAFLEAAGLGNHNQISDREVGHYLRFH